MLKSAHTDQNDDVPNSRRLSWLDLVRSISVLLIVVYHYRSQFVFQYPKSTAIRVLGVLNNDFGDLGVAVFIMISGAALMLATSDNIALLEYFKKRFLAIYPSYWVAFVVASAFCLILNKHLNDSGEYYKLILSVIAMDGFFLYKTPAYYVIGEWFVGFIVFLYLLFPLLRPVVQRNPLTALALFPIVYLLAVPLYDAQHFDLLAQRNPLLRLPDLVFGMLFVRFGLSREKWLAAVALVCIAGLYWFPVASMALPYKFLASALFFSFFSAAAGYVLIVPKAESIIAFVSKYSFLAFLVHHQIIYAFLNRLDLSNATALQANALCALIVVLSFGVAIVLHPVVRRLTDALRTLLDRHPASRIPN